MTGGIFYETQMGTRVHAGRAGRGGAAFSVRRVAESAHGGPRAGQRERVGAPEAAVLAVPRGRVRALARGADDARGRWCGLLVGLLAAPLLLLGAYYPLRYGFGVHGLWLDLLLYVLAMGAGAFLAYRLQRRALPGWLCGPLVIAAGIYGAALALFSFAPPDLPIFRP